MSKWIVGFVVYRQSHKQLHLVAKLSSSPLTSPPLSCTLLSADEEESWICGQGELLGVGPSTTGTPRPLPPSLLCKHFLLEPPCFEKPTCRPLKFHAANPGIKVMDNTRKRRARVIINVLHPSKVERNQALELVQPEGTFLEINSENPLITTSFSSIVFL